MGFETLSETTKSTPANSPKIEILHSEIGESFRPRLFNLLLNSFGCRIKIRPRSHPLQYFC
jgi:hypothetical protein